MKILAVGAHPDDIEAQIGGTIAKLGNSGAKTLLVAATATSTGASSSELRDNEASMGSKCIGSNFVSLGISPDEFSFSRKYISIFDDLFDAESQTWSLLLTLWTVIMNINLFPSAFALRLERILSPDLLKSSFSRRGWSTFI